MGIIGGGSRKGRMGWMGINRIVGCMRRRKKKGKKGKGKDRNWVSRQGRLVIISIRSSVLRTRYSCK